MYSTSIFCVVKIVPRDANGFVLSAVGNVLKVTNYLPKIGPQQTILLRLKGKDANFPKVSYGLKESNYLHKIGQQQSF